MLKPQTEEKGSPLGRKALMEGSSMTKGRSIDARSPPVTGETS